MKTLLLPLLLLFTIISNAQIVNIPDPNFKYVLLHHNDYGGDVIDINGDGEIQVAEAEAITVLLVGDPSLHQHDVSDLTGIEAFVNLVELDCGYNDLTTLDVSQNTALEYLNCSGNQLTALNVGQNTALKSLSCLGNNISSLDLSQNIFLRSLVCYDNQITALDLTQNPLLDFIIVKNNQLTSLDLTQNNLILSINCSNNQLNSLDIRNGNNTDILHFTATGNPDLTCIFVDDANYSANNPDWAIDPSSTYVETQTECDAITAVEDFLFQEIKIYPNPVKDKLFIEAVIPIRTVEILNLNGKKIKSFDFSNKREINLPQLSPGIYFLKFYNKSKQILTTKIIKL